MAKTQVLGTVSVVPMGDWNSTTTYQKGNLVRYNKATYMAKVANVNVTPSVSTNWQQIWMLFNYDGVAEIASETPLPDTENGDVGQSAAYARADHQHEMSEIYESASDATEKWEQQAQVNAGKLDKNSGTLGNTQVYGVNAQGEQVMLQTTNGMDVMPVANSIPRYNNGGYLVSLDINEETAGPNTLTPKGYVDGIKEDIDEQLSFVPRAAANNSPTSGESVTVPNTPATFLRAQDYGTIFTHKRLWDGNLYDEGFNQLVDPEKYVLIQTNGITWTKNADGSLHAEGTFINEGWSSCYSYRKKTPFIIGHKYFLNDILAQYVNFSLINGTNNDKQKILKIESYQADEGTGSVYSYVQKEVGDSVNETFYPQLIDLTAFENATGKTINTVDDWNALYPDFYPYVPTISPETPLEIVPSGNKSNVVTSGKNLVFPDDWRIETPVGIFSFFYSKQTGKVTVKAGAADSVSQSVYHLPIPIPKGTTVSITAICESGMFNGTLSIGGYHYSAEQISWQGEINFPKNTYLTGKTFTKTIVTTDTVTDFWLFDYAGTTVSEDVVFQVQYEIGEATSYVPYVEPVTTEINYTAVTPAEQSLIDNAVTLGDYASERNGNTVTVQNGKYIVTGTENFIMGGNDDVKDFYKFYMASGCTIKNGVSQSGFCNKYNTIKYLENKEGVLFGAYNAYIYFYLPKERFKTVQDVKSYFAEQYASGEPVIVYYPLTSPETVEIEEIAPIPTFGNNDTTFTSEAVGTSNAPVELDLTTYIAKNLPKGYSLLKDKDGNLIVAYTQTNMLYDVNTDKYLSDLLNLKDTATGTVYKITVTNGAITLVALPAETEETI